MARSRLPLVRIILVPYLLLFFLFVLITGAGSTWLYFKAREAQSQFLMHGLLTTVSPLVEELSQADTDPLIADQTSWLHRKLEALFIKMSDLEQVQVRSAAHGFSKRHNATHGLFTKTIPGRSAEQGQKADLRSSTAASRLYSETEPLLRIEFSFDDRKNGPVTMEFAFSRATLQDAVGRAMSTMVNAITLFNITGIGALLLAFGVTLWGAGRVRWLEQQVQELYRYATAAELMAGLVHDLRNPLASFRANIASLKIMPQESAEILEEMDQDLVRLDDKLASMLDLTRKRDEPLNRVDVEQLLGTVHRHVEPVLQKNNITMQIKNTVEQPIELMENSLRDTLLNLVLNSAESGQQGGNITVAVYREKQAVVFEISDRGHGLPEDTDIFAPFVTTKATGHGLGLAISRRTVEAHGGTLEARNRQGGGALFIVRIPQPPVIGRKV